MDEKLQLKIEAYLGGTLSQEEITLFEEQMDQDPQLAMEVQLSRDVNLHLKGFSSTDVIPDNEYTQKLRETLRNEGVAIKEAVKEAHKKYAKDTPGFRRRNFLMIAATIAILLVGTFALFNLRGTSPEKLYAQYYATEDLPSMIKRDDTTSALKEGVLAFQEQDYQMALSSFDAYLKSGVEIDPGVYLYQGAAHMELEAIEEALKAFDKMISSNSLDRSKGLWFKALAYLKAKETENAKSILQDIVDHPEYFNHSQAKELLEDL
ncbi:MAG: tetratricopeptide repeat protein [Bacteroidota bacterium]